MNTKLLTLTAVTTLFAAGSALAQLATPRYPTAWESPMTRAEVQEEALHAADEGLIAQGEIYPVLEATGPQRSRAQVVAEMLTAKRFGLLPRGERAPIATAAQRKAIREAGIMALNSERMARGK